MKTKEKTNPMNQEAINEIAKNAYIAELFGKAKSKLIDGIRPCIDEHEAEFRAGVPAEFEYDGHLVRCKLTMTPAPKWSDKEVVIIEK